MENFQGDPTDVPPSGYNHARNQSASRMIYYAHTATQSDGARDPDESQRQPRRTHLENAAVFGAGFWVVVGAQPESTSAATAGLAALDMI